MKKDRFALIDFDGNVKVTGNNKQDLEETLAKSIEDLREAAGNFRRVAKGELESYRGISDPIEAGQTFMRMMAQADQRRNWAVVENN